MSFDHVIFDFDGVVSDSLRVACEEVNYLSESRFPKIPQVYTQEDMALVFSGPLQTSLRRFGLSDEESRNFYDIHSEAMRRRSKEVEPFCQVVSAIAGTVKGRCSLVTSSYSDAARTILKKSLYYTESLFYTIRGRELHEPKSKKILDILKELKISTERAIYVGDMVSDILYCRSVLISIVAVGYGYHSGSYLRVFDPEFYAETPQDLAFFLAKYF